MCLLKYFCTDLIIYHFGQILGMNVTDGQYCNVKVTIVTERQLTHLYNHSSQVSLWDAFKKKVHMEGNCPNHGGGGKKNMSNVPT